MWYLLKPLVLLRNLSLPFRIQFRKPSLFRLLMYQRKFGSDDSLDIYGSTHSKRYLWFPTQDQGFQFGRFLTWNIGILGTLLLLGHLKTTWNCEDTAVGEDRARWRLVLKCYHFWKHLFQEQVYHPVCKILLLLVTWSPSEDSKFFRNTTIGPSWLVCVLSGAPSETWS